MKTKFNNFCFLILLIGVFFWGAAVFIKGETKISKVENRALNTFRTPTLSEFLDGTFQQHLEEAMSDQFLGSEQIRIFYNGIMAKMPDFWIQQSACSNKYLVLNSDSDRSRGIYDCQDYIVYLPEPITDEWETTIQTNIAKYNNINRLAETYYYFVDDSSSFDFVNNQKVADYENILKNGLVGEAGLASLNVRNFDDYKKYFYKTDHHWNCRGSYQGFLDIANMLGIKDPAQPKGSINNHEFFFGSQARNTNNYDYQEEFELLRFTIPAHKTMINGKEEKYNHIQEYENHEYEYDKTTNYYGAVYGWDYGEVAFDFMQPDKDNLLIISNSYSNAINELIAQYFNKTYVIDLRYFKEEQGVDFNVENYINEKHIDKVLLLISPTFIRSAESNRGLESNAV